MDINGPKKSTLRIYYIDNFAAPKPVWIVPNSWSKNQSRQSNIALSELQFENNPLHPAFYSHFMQYVTPLFLISNNNNTIYYNCVSKQSQLTVAVQY